jgi:two-component system sensor histidine kinase RegB
LATPLSTIRTAAGELERNINKPNGASSETNAEYITIIREEVDRCTRVLDQLSGRAAATSASESKVMLANLIEDLRYRLGESLADRLDVSIAPHVEAIDLPGEPLRQALIALLRNAFDASTADQRVTMRIENANGLRLEVIDRGRGMDETEQARAGEPFFSTKPAGAGLGLGLFLVRAFADQMGGTLSVRSTPGAGTSAILELPAR